MFVAKRDVSPVGASRFERPYSPPSAVSASTPTATAPSSPVEATVPPLPAHNHTTRPSVASTTPTYSTAPTSIDSSLDAELKALTNPPRDGAVDALAEEPDDWSEKMISGPVGPSSFIDEGSHECPDRATLAAVRQIPIYDANGNSIPFGSLYEPYYSDTTSLSSSTSDQMSRMSSRARHLIIFVRYFYCPACTAYIKTLAEEIRKREVDILSPPTTLTIIGCGQPDIIHHYQKITACPFDLYVDPTRELFKKLGMRLSLNVGGTKPEYMDKGLMGASREEIKVLKTHLRDEEGFRKRDLLRGGNPMQIGGEFLFEGGEVVWCHRMKNYRNHAEIGALRRLLGLGD